MLFATFSCCWRGAIHVSNRADVQIHNSTVVHANPTDTAVHADYACAVRHSETNAVSVASPDAGAHSAAHSARSVLLGRVPRPNWRQSNLSGIVVAVWHARHSVSLSEPKLRSILHGRRRSACVFSIRHAARVRLISRFCSFFEKDFFSRNLTVKFFYFSLNSIFIFSFTQLDNQCHRLCCTRTNRANWQSV